MRLSLRVGIFSLPIRAERNWLGSLPLRRGMRRIKLDCMRNVGSDYFGVRGRTRYGLPGFTQHQMYPQKQWDDKKPPKHRTSIAQKINLTAISG